MTEKCEMGLLYYFSRTGYQGPKTRNDMDEKIKDFSLTVFKTEPKKEFSWQVTDFLRFILFLQFPLNLALRVCTCACGESYCVFRPVKLKIWAPKSFRARKSMSETVNRLFWKSDLLTCFQGNKKQNHVTVKIDY